MAPSASDLYAELKNSKKTGDVIKDRIFIRLLNSPGTCEINNEEFHITPKCKKVFDQELKDRNRKYFDKVMVRFRKSEDRDFVHEEVCDLKPTTGQKYLRFKIPKVSGKLIFVLRQNDLYTMQCNGKIDVPDIGQVPNLLVIIYPPGIEGVKAALQDGIEGNRAAVAQQHVPPRPVARALNRAGEVRNQIFHPPEQLQQSGPGGPSAKAQRPGNLAKVAITLGERRIASPLDISDNGLNDRFKKIVTNASTYILESEEALSLLEDFHTRRGITWPTEAAERPEGGKLFVFNNKVCRHYRRDKHEVSSKESHGKLIVGGEERLKCYYLNEPDGLQRRIYWDLEDSKKHIVLVHYLPTNSKVEEGSEAEEEEEEVEEEEVEVEEEEEEEEVEEEDELKESDIVDDVSDTDKDETGTIDTSEFVPEDENNVGFGTRSEREGADFLMNIKMVDKNRKDARENRRLTRGKGDRLNLIANEADDPALSLKILNMGGGTECSVGGAIVSARTLS